GARHRAAGLVVPLREAVLRLVLAHLREPLLRAEAGIDAVLLEQRLRGVPVDRVPLRLAVGAARPALLGALVRIEPEPLQPLEDGATRRLGVALLVGVLEAQHERAPLLPRVKPVEERRARSAAVEVARGAGREA